jgi:integrase
MKLQLKHYIAQSGERFSLLYDVSHEDTDSSAFPLFYPTAYVTRQLNSQMHSSQIERLQAVKKLYMWAHQEKPELDLHQTLLSQQFLRPHQIDSITSFLGRKNKHGSTISQGRHNRMIKAVAEYLAWYAYEIVPSSNSSEIASSIERMKNAFKARCNKRQGSTSRERQVRLTKRLSADTREALLELFKKPLKCGSLKALEGTRYRNVLALYIMYSTGIRLGEVLSLQLQDFSIASGGESAYLRVRRNHDAREDDRTPQPVAKTLGRILPIADELAKAIEEYLIQRSHIPHVDFDEKAFLLVNFMKGPRQGLGMNIQNFHTSLAHLKKQFPVLDEVHAHLLRHDWNYRFSLKAKTLSLNEHEEAAIREYWMGWVKNSQSAMVYNQRYVEEQAWNIGLMMANDTLKRGE